MPQHETDHDIVDLIPKISDKKKFYFHNFKYKKEKPLVKKDSQFLFQKTKLKKMIQPEKSAKHPGVRRIENLPFMGTISLENLNQKPRRGRKPSPAASSIINLIKKNYGIDVTSHMIKPTELETVDKIKSIKHLCDEPLNLCVRDPHMKMSSLNSKGIIKHLESTTQRKKKVVHSISPELLCKDSFNKNEVSICKFKLANGSLQEKKKFCVVNGNFNYGHANITKSNQLKRYIHKESQKATKSNLNSNESMLLTESNPNNQKKSQTVGVISNSNSNSLKNFETGRGGFLIQTQEQTSNQCGFYKFRHLKTISRYLFRNWKKFLPPNSKVDKKNPSIN